MTRTTFLLSTAALTSLIGLGSCARAPAPAPSVRREAPAPPEPLQFFVGEWEGKNTAASGRKTTLRWRVASTLGGRWLAGVAHVAELGVEARDFLGVQGGRIVRVYVDNQGSRATMSSPGWQGTEMTFQGEVHGADGSRVRVREIVTRVDSNTLHERWERWSEGAWALMSEETLHRTDD